MRHVFKFLVLLFIASGSAHAQTITAPESSVCLDNNGGAAGTGCDTGNLQPGNTYLLQSSRFQDFQGNPYDVAVEVLLKTTPDPRLITAFGQVDTGGFVQYNISFVNPVSMPMTVSPSSLTLFQPEDTIFSAFFEDIDSNDNSGGTFSEFVGVDTRNIDSPQFVLSGDTKLTTGVFDTDLDGDVERALTQFDGGVGLILVLMA